MNIIWIPYQKYNNLRDKMGGCISCFKPSSKVYPDDMATNASAEDHFGNNQYAYHFKIEKVEKDKERKRYRGMTLKIGGRKRGWWPISIAVLYIVRFISYNSNQYQNRINKKIQLKNVEGGEEKRKSEKLPFLFTHN